MNINMRRKLQTNLMLAMGGGIIPGARPMFAQTGVPETGSFVPMGGVQQGPDGVNGNPPPGPIGGPMPPMQRRGGGGAGRPRRPQPAGIYWISGTGIERQPDGVPWDIKEHTRLSMENIKRGVEARGGTMNSFLYMQVFFCLHLDDGTPMPTGSAKFAAYQQGYLDLNSVYNTYWQGGAPPRSCFALKWIPGKSLVEIVGAAYLDPNAPPPPPRAGQ